MSRPYKQEGYLEWDPSPPDPGALGEFIEAYIEAALWSEMDPETEEYLDKNYSVGDIDLKTLNGMVKDAERFFKKYRADVEENPVQGGRDFWFTRNHHGTGFWDGDWPKKIGEKLTKAAHKYGEVSLYIGDDGKIHST